MNESGIRGFCFRSIVLLSLVLAGFLSTASHASSFDAPELTTSIIDPLTHQELKILHNSLLPVGHDVFAVSTKNGTFFWNPLAKTVMPVTGILPDNQAIHSGWPMHSGSLLVLTNKTAVEDNKAQVVWWDSTAHPVSDAVPIEPMNYLKFVTLSNTQVMLCGEKAGRHSARVVSLRAQGNGMVPTLDESPDLHAVLAKAGVVGKVQGVADINADEVSLPVQFDTSTCLWYVKSLPPIYDTKLENFDGPLKTGMRARAAVSFLSGGRILAGIEKVGVPGYLNPLLMWTSQSPDWQPIELTYVSGSGINDTDVTMTESGVVVAYEFQSGFIEFLDVDTRKWLRSEQRAPDNMDYLHFEGLSDGSVIAQEGFESGILNFRPLQQSSTPRLRYPHTVEIQLKNGNSFYPGIRSEMRLANTAAYELRAPMPVSATKFQLVELADGSVVASAFEHPECSPLIEASQCKQAIRYFPEKDSWQWINNLAVPIADAVKRQNGDLVFLKSSGENLENNPDELVSQKTELFRWREDEGQVTMAPLIQPRLGGLLFNLHDGRLVVVGGKTPGFLIATEASCSGCPEQLVSVGDVSPSRTTEVYDDTAQRWQPGPPSHYAGGRAVMLANGQLFKLAPSRLYDDESSRAEITDAAFTAWIVLPQLPVIFQEVYRLEVLGNTVRVIGNLSDKQEDIALGGGLFIRRTKLEDTAAAVWDGNNQIWRIEKP